MEQFLHVRSMIGIILGLSIAHLLKGVAKIIEHPSRKHFYWVHLLWVFYTFLLLIDFWWWEFRLAKVAEWNFLSYCFIIFYIIIYYIMCSLLFPDDLREYDGFKGYYYDKRNWFFGLMALTFLTDIGDTLLKGKTYYESLGTEYPIRITLHFILCLAAIKVKKEWFHALLVIAFILYGISWTLRKYLVQ